MRDSPLLKSSEGYRVRGTDIWIDPVQPKKVAILSHAHADHARPGNEIVYCSKGTAALLQARYGRFAHTIVQTEWQEEFNIEGIPFSLHPAGHILGSAQIRFELEGEKVLYTGDFNRQPNPSCEAFVPTSCDVLISECTFASAGYVHPPEEEIVKILQEKLDRANLVIGAYAMGKAQRLSEIISRNFESVQLHIHPKILPYHAAYQRMGFSTGTGKAYHKAAFRRNRNQVLIVSPNVFRSFPHAGPWLRGFASGFSERSNQADFHLPLSDHADWNDLNRTLHESGANVVYAVHGHSAEWQEFHKNADIRFLNLTA